MDVTLDQLRVLVEVVDQGGFTAAARAQRRAQGAVSYHVARLEEQLGVTLFDRSGRRPVLTEAGSVMVRHARGVLRGVDRMVSTAEELVAGVEPALSVCVDVLVPPAYVAHLLQTFETRFPNVPLSVVTGVFREPVDALREGRAHLAIATPRASSGNLRMHPVVEVAFVPVVSAGHPLARRSAPIPVRELVDHRRLVLASGPPLPEDGLRQGEIWRLDNAATRRGLLLEGVGWSRVADWQVEDDVAAGRLVALETDGSLGPSHVMLAVAVDPDRPIGPATRWLYDALVSRASERGR
ncbi:MAG: LysR family transcriptional regulator [Myxococcales bacterium]|nr:LysR family transcriptional regulator [Myxococcales bacterium]